MNIEQVREYTLSLPGVTEDQAFGEDILNCPVREILLPSWKKIATQLEKKCGPVRQQKRGTTVAGIILHRKIRSTPRIGLLTVPSKKPET